jgi:hypothetical protein
VSQAKCYSGTPHCGGHRCDILHVETLHCFICRRRTASASVKVVLSAGAVFLQSVKEGCVFSVHIFTSFYYLAEMGSYLATFRESISVSS